MAFLPEIFLGVLALSGLALAQAGTPSPLVGPIEYLWPHGAPGAVGQEERDKPSLSVYLAGSPGRLDARERSPGEEMRGRIRWCRRRSRRLMEMDPIIR
jgi:hypothetical protein